MVRITVDEALKQQLLAADGVVELCDEAGRLIATATAPKDNPLAGWVPLTSPISEEELRRRMESKEPGLSTKEVIEHLRSRP